VSESRRVSSTTAFLISHAWAGKPFDPSFKFHGGARLTLFDIAPCRFPAVNFASLSTLPHCRVETDGSIPVHWHLTAAMPHSEFRNLVSTMWAMRNTDGREVYEHFYELVLSLAEGQGR
ncbi:hypothetical protein BJV78DRAFT_1094974, partial [Lactifluus subvellereus]